MAAIHNAEDRPEGIFSLLDTDLYKLTMQCALLKYFAQISEVLYDASTEFIDHDEAIELG